MANQVLIRDELVKVLMEKVWTDPYPSIDMLDKIEKLLDPLELQEYAEMLLERIRHDKFPSWGMIYRLHDLAERQLYAAMATRR
ncbi:MAG TPA: hypothetical protein VNP20_23635 [Nocardioidaceae bacterium]|nr:hypothetical protein [Nocardioidaceae bacterium]